MDFYDSYKRAERLEEGVFNTIKSGIGKAVGAVGGALDSEKMMNAGAQLQGSAAGNKERRQAGADQAKQAAYDQAKSGTKPQAQPQEKPQAQTQPKEQAQPQAQPQAKPTQEKPKKSTQASSQAPSSGPKTQALFKSLDSFLKNGKFQESNLSYQGQFIHLALREADASKPQKNSWSAVRAFKKSPTTETLEAAKKELESFKAKAGPKTGGKIDEILKQFEEAGAELGGAGGGSEAAGGDQGSSGENGNGTQSNDSPNGQQASQPNAGEGPTQSGDQQDDSNGAPQTQASDPGSAKEFYQKYGKQLSRVLQGVNRFAGAGDASNLMKSDGDILIQLGQIAKKEGS